METIRYFLRPHVFLCLTSRYVVILDVRRDRYECVLRRHFDPLVPWLSGWPRERTSDASHPRPPPETSVLELASQFVSRGILTCDSAGSKPACPISIPIPGPRDRSQGRPPLHSVLRKSALFLLACRRADIALRRQSFEAVVNAVETGRHRGRIHAPQHTGRAVRLAAVFDVLRPIYPRPYLCTFDSLALVQFLAYHRVRSRWVFGVRADPFYAHCWVQYGDTLLNDSIERVLPLTPIMAV